MSLETPVAFFIFNRPDLTAKVFAEIVRAAPKHLLIVADGPRSQEEAALCQAARAVVEQIDWDCNVKRNYSEENLGCKLRVSSGINWVFSEVEEAIILEDDCLPHPSFFRFCEEMLIRYRHDDRIMHVSGANLVPQTSLKCSYQFSRLVPIWGWATWRRAWGKYDISMRDWPEYKETQDFQYFGNQHLNVAHFLDEVYHEIITTWDGQWWYSCLILKGLSIISNSNLIHNMGCRPDATHTTASSHVTRVPIETIEFPLVSPPQVCPNHRFDYKYLEFCYGRKSRKLTRFLRQVVRRVAKI